ncbi:recombinase family protein [Streptomyces sp. NPDC048275]|uniref:recombinase family protein n=1 Tax=Streptomyces sp. NPDC048275 TaxID=3155629 RepID=UPI0033C88E03
MAVISTRISHDPTGKAEGVTRQEEACRKLAADLGWQVVDVKTDDDLTAIGKRGQRAQRPAFAALLDMLSAREADTVIVWQPTACTGRHVTLNRMKDKYAANRRAGINHGGGRPFGYTL